MLSPQSIVSCYATTYTSHYGLVLDKWVKDVLCQNYPFCHICFYACPIEPVAVGIKRFNFLELLQV